MHAVEVEQDGVVPVTGDRMLAFGLPHQSLPYNSLSPYSEARTDPGKVNRHHTHDLL